MVFLLLLEWLASLFQPSHSCFHSAVDVDLSTYHNPFPASGLHSEHLQLKWQKCQILPTWPAASSASHLPIISPCTENLWRCRGGSLTHLLCLVAYTPLRCFASDLCGVSITIQFLLSPGPREPDSVSHSSSQQLVGVELADQCLKAFETIQNTRERVAGQALTVMLKLLGKQNCCIQMR